MAIGFPTKANWAAGDVLTASQMDDLAGTLNTVSAPLYNAAGKNKIINGDFGIWQRGTSFTITTAQNVYTADRFSNNFDGTGATRIISQQTFTPGTAPVSGYEGTYFYRFNQSVAGSGGTYNNCLIQSIEDVRIFAGQTVTVSFWAKADAARAITIGLNQSFGSGGSSIVFNTVGTITASTTWARYTASVALPSLTGKTIGTSSSLQLVISCPTNTTQTIDFWGVQVEAGSTATGFQTATGTVQGELAACQRYYQRYTAQGAYTIFSSSGIAGSTTVAVNTFTLPTRFRTTPSSTLEYGNIGIWDTVNAVVSVSAITIYNAGVDVIGVSSTVASGLTQYRPYYLIANNNSSAYIGFSAEL